MRVSCLLDDSTKLIEWRVILISTSVQSSIGSIWECKNCQKQQFEVKFRCFIYVLLSSKILCLTHKKLGGQSVDLESLLRYNLIRMGRYLELQFVLTFLKDHVFAKSLTRRETTIVFTCSAQHHQRWFPDNHARIVGLALQEKLSDWCSLSGCREIQVRGPKNFPLFEPNKLSRSSKRRWCKGVFGNQKCNGYCRDQPGWTGMYSSHSYGWFNGLFISGNLV